MMTHRPSAPRACERRACPPRTNGRSPEFLFTENESNARRLFNSPNESPYVKDAFHDYIVHRRKDSVSPRHEGHSGVRD